MKCERCGNSCIRGDVSWWCRACSWARPFTDAEMETLCPYNNSDEKPEAAVPVPVPANTEVNHYE